MTRTPFAQLLRPLSLTAAAFLLAACPSANTGTSSPGSAFTAASLQEHPPGDAPAKTANLQDTPHEARSAADASSKAFTLDQATRLGFERKAVSDSIFSRPHDVVLSPDGSFLLVADIGNDVIQVLNPETLRVITTFGGADLDSPHDVAFQNFNTVLVADTLNNRIAVYRFNGVDRNGKAQVSLIDSWSDGMFRPEGVAPSPNGGPVYVTNVGDHSVAMLDAQGKLQRKAGGRGSEPLKFVRPHDIAVDEDGRVIVVDSGNHRIQVLTGVLDFIEELKGPPYHFYEPKYIAFGGDGKLFIADEYNSQIKILDDAFEPIDFIGTGKRGAGPKELNWPEGVEVRGDQLWIADTYNDRILRYRKRSNKPEPKIIQFSD